MVKKSLLENQKMLVAIIGVASAGVIGGSIFGVYRNNQIKEAATQQEVIVDNDATDPSLLNDKSGQETVDFESLCKGWYDTHQSEIKEDTTWDEWYAQGKVFWQDTNKSEEDTLSGLLAYFAPDTILPDDVDDPESMEVKVDKEDADIVNAEMLGDDDNASEEESVETVEVEANEATTEASTTDASTDTITNTKDFEVDYYDKSKTMYAIRTVNVRKGPDANDFEKVLTLKTNDAVEVIGVVDEYNGKEVYWTAVKINGQEYYISGVYLSDSKVQTTTSSGNSSSSNSSQQQSSGTQQQSSSSNSNTSNNSSNSSARDKLKNAQHDSGNNVQSTTPQDAGNTGIQWH
jgi:hypothetical protein